MVTDIATCAPWVVPEAVANCFAGRVSPGSSRTATIDHAGTGRYPRTHPSGSRIESESNPPKLPTEVDACCFAIDAPKSVSPIPFRGANIRQHPAESGSFFRPTTWRMGNEVIEENETFNGSWSCPSHFITVDVSPDPLSPCLPKCPRKSRCPPAGNSWAYLTPGVPLGGLGIASDLPPVTGSP